MLSIPIPANTSLQEKAPAILANATFAFAGYGLASFAITAGKFIASILPATV